MEKLIIKCLSLRKILVTKTVLLGAIFQVGSGPGLSSSDQWLKLESKLFQWLSSLIFGQTCNLSSKIMQPQKLKKTKVEIWDIFNHSSKAWNDQLVNKSVSITKRYLQFGNLKQFWFKLFFFFSRHILLWQVYCTIYTYTNLFGPQKKNKWNHLCT